MNIHTFGDSHSRFGFRDNPLIHTYDIASSLCYSFGRDKFGRLNIMNYNVQENDIVIFCFGEIDCRCHINKYITNDISYTNIIDEIIDNYFIAINLNVNQFNKLHVCVYNVVPPVEKYNTHENTEYPYLGTDNDRQNYVLYFNKKLKEKCIQHKYIFFDIYDKYIDKKGFLSKKLSDGNVHILNGIYIHEFLNSIINNISIPKPIEKPIPISKQIPKPIAKPNPIAKIIPIEKPIAIPIEKPIPISKQIPKPIAKPNPIAKIIPIEKPIAKPILIEKPIAKPILIENQIQIPISKPNKKKFKLKIIK